jgi:hypothetical protein
MKDHRAYLVTIGAFEMISGGVFLVHPHLLGRSVDSYSAQVYGAALASLGFSILYDALVSNVHSPAIILSHLLFYFITLLPRILLLCFHGEHRYLPSIATHSLFCFLLISALRQIRKNQIVYTLGSTKPWH